MSRSSPQGSRSPKLNYLRENRKTVNQGKGLQAESSEGALANLRARTVEVAWRPEWISEVAPSPPCSTVWVSTPPTNRLAGLS